MVSRNIIAFLGLASTALATFGPEALGDLSDLRVERVVVEVRQAQSSTTTDSLSSECVSIGDAVLTDVPSAPASLTSYFASYRATADKSDFMSYICGIRVDVPATLTSAYSSYDQAASSWFNKHKSDFSVIASKCVNNDDASTIEAVVSAFEASVSGCAGATTPSKGWAARPTGVVAGAVAAAGVLGAAAVL
ncbi:hypothetical protein F4805DRAFT_431856 [Annulohypoxylon moriforme]|nr:hypothetical protein F4805DRAFT_431856 [Annulohypoxylon moriforme]